MFLMPEKPVSVWKLWLLAIRPKTLGAAIAPVLIGTAMAFEAEKGHLLSAFAALAGALLIQVGTNLSNDYFDFVKGADTEDRLGPTRATQAGWVRPEAVLKASIIIFGIAALVGVYLVCRGGWPILLIGLISIISGVLYTGGPFPLGYIGLGELFVLVFFGPVATGGTFYVQAFELPAEVVFAGMAPGLLSTSLLVVNNLRDINTDRRAGKHTLAVFFGPRFARFEYTLCLVAAFCVPMLMAIHRQSNWFALSSLLALIPAIPCLKCVLGSNEGIVLNQALANTGKILLFFSLLFSTGWLIG